MWVIARVRVGVVAGSHLVNPNPNPNHNPNPNQANPRVAALFAPGGFLEGGPAGALAMKHLTTQYHAVDMNVQDPMMIRW